jgi:hypothetical protein
MKPMKPLRMKVLKVVKPDKIQYPLQGRSTSGKDDPGLNEALGTMSRHWKIKMQNQVKNLIKWMVTGIVFNSN